MLRKILGGVLTAIIFSALICISPFQASADEKVAGKVIDSMPADKKARFESFAANYGFKTEEADENTLLLFLLLDNEAKINALMYRMGLSKDAVNLLQSPTKSFNGNIIRSIE